MYGVFCKQGPCLLFGKYENMKILYWGCEQERVWLRYSRKIVHPAMGCSVAKHAPARTPVRYSPIFRIKGRDLVYGKSRYLAARE
jgi:hypothetical protein